MCCLLWLLGLFPALRAEPLRLDTLEPPAALEGTWRFQPGDDPAFAAPGLDDSSWAEVRIPGTLERQGFDGVEMGWYRRTVELPAGVVGEGRELRLGARIGNVLGAYELYAGGTFLGGRGKLPPEPRLEYDHHRVYAIPPEAVGGDGRLVLALRVWVPQVPGFSGSGAYGGPFEIGRLEELTRRAAVDELPELVLAVLFAAVGLYHLLVFWRRQKLEIYLWFALFALVNAAFTFLRTQWRFALSDDFALLKEGEYFARYLLPALAIQFLWPLLGRPIGRWLRAYQLSHALLAVVALVVPGLGLNLATVRWSELWVLPAIGLILGLIVLRAWQGDPEARTLCFGFLVLGATYLNDIFAGRGLLTTPSLSHYGFAAFILSMAVSLANRFTRVYGQVDALNRELEARVEERTRELAAATERAEAASRAKSEWLSNVSHELRTPMSRIMGFAELLDRTRLSREQRAHVEEISSSTAVLRELVDDVLDAAAIELGQLTLEPADFDLERMLKSVVRLLAPRARAQGLELTLELDPDLPRLARADPERLRQVLINLLGNALKFTEEGEVRVRARRVRCGEAKPWVRFEVADTGIGLDTDALPGLFETFTQLDGSTTRRFGGSGLGLAICRAIVEEMGGEIGAESHLGEGSTFFFEVPLEVVPRPGVFEPAEPTPPVSVVPRVLVAEDDPAVITVTAAALEEMGVRVELVADGRRAVAALEKGRYDLVLMDCQMPELDGYEVTRWLRRHEAGGGRRTPVVAVTAHAMGGERERCLAAGMDDYLAKPFTFPELGEVVGRWLPSLRVEKRPERPPTATAEGEGDDPLDRTYVEQLRRLDEETGHDLLGEALGLYLEQAPGQLETVRRALAEGDEVQAQRTTHTLKGSSAQLGAARLAGLCAALEKAVASDGGTAVAEDCLEPLERELGRVSEELRRVLAARGRPGPP